jgi:hypothetical protein
MTPTDESFVPTATIYSESDNMEPGLPLPGGALVVPSLVGAENNLTVNTTATGSADGLYLGQGFYWLVVGAPNGYSVGMQYVNGTIAPNTSMPIAIHDFAIRTDPTSPWYSYVGTSLNGQFQFRASGCDLTLRPSPSPTAQPSASPTRPSPSRSAIPTPSAKIVPLANATASFDSTAAAEVQVTAPLNSNGALVYISLSPMRRNADPRGRTWYRWEERSGRVVPVRQLGSGERDLARFSSHQYVLSHRLAALSRRGSVT